jgi:multiple sugar transport system ATP-binding protein
VQMRIELARLHTDLGTTMVYVTHDQTEAMTLGHRIAVFNNGRIEQVGPPLVLYRSPVNRFVAEFLGSPKINVLPYQWQPDASVRVGAQTLCDLNLSTQALERLRKGASLGIRPEAFHLSADGQGWAGELGFVENLGDVQMAYVRCEGLEEWLRVKVNAPGMALVAGQKVCCCPDMAQCLVMDADGRVIP